MIDYLSRLAEKAATPSTSVRPFLRPLFADLSTHTSDSQIDGSSSLDEFIDVESTAPWSEAQTPQSNEVVAVSSGGPGIRARTEQSKSRATQVRSHQVDIPLVGESLSEFDEPNELRSSSATSRQHPKVTEESVPAAESSQEQRPASPIPVDVRRQETSSFKAAFHSSDIREVRPTRGKLKLQIDPPAVHSTDEGQQSLPRVAKPVLAEQQKLFGGVLNSVVETDTERESVLLLPRVHTRGRAKEIIPLSAITPLPDHSTRSQSVSSPVVQPAAETTVHVTIGRVEVRATVGPQKSLSGRASSSRESSRSLEDYLRGTSSGRSS